MSKFVQSCKIVFVSQVGVAILSFLLAVALARLLGPELRGVLVLVFLIPLIVKMVTAGGLSASIVYNISSERWADEDLLPKTITIWMILSFVMLVLGSLALYILSHFEIYNSSQSLYWQAIISLPVLFACDLGVAVLTGFHRFKSILYVEVFGTTITLVITLLFLVFLNLSIEGAVYAWVIGYICKMIACLIAVRTCLIEKNRHAKFGLNWNLRSELKYGLKAQASNIAAFLSYRLDQVIVSSFLGVTALGLYTVAVNCAEKLWILVSSVPSVVLPTSAAPENQNSREYGEFIARVSAICLVALAFSAVILGMVSDYFFSALFGSEYRSSALFFVALLPGVVALGHAKILANYIAGIGAPGYNAIRGYSALGLNVVLNLILIPAVGIVGAAIATSVSYVCSALAAWIIFSKLSKVSYRNSVIPRAEDVMRIVDAVKGLTRRKLQRGY